MKFVVVGGLIATNDLESFKNADLLTHFHQPFLNLNKLESIVSFQSFTTQHIPSRTHHLHYHLMGQSIYINFTKLLLFSHFNRTSPIFLLLVQSSQLFSIKLHQVKLRTPQYLSLVNQLFQVRPYLTLQHPLHYLYGFYVC